MALADDCTTKVLRPTEYFNRSQKPERLTRSGDKTCPTLGVFTLGAMTQLGGDPAGGT